MALDIKPLVREFQYKGTTLPDPNPSLNPNDVRDIHAQSHPELVNAAIDGPKNSHGKQIYTYVVSAGTKG